MKIIKSTMSADKVNIVSYQFKQPDLANYLKQLAEHPNAFPKDRVPRMGKFFAAQGLMDKASPDYYQDINCLAHFSVSNCIPSHKRTGTKYKFLLNKDALDAIDPGILERFNDHATKIGAVRETESMSNKYAQVLFGLPIIP